MSCAGRREIGGKQYFACVIIKVNRGGTYDVKFEDGTKQHKVSADLFRKKQNQILGPVPGCDTSVTRVAAKKRPKSRGSSKDECCFCLEELTDASSLECGHLLHTDCVYQILMANAAESPRLREARLLCPLCRTETGVRMSAFDPFPHTHRTRYLKPGALCEREGVGRKVRGVVVDHHETSEVCIEWEDTGVAQYPRADARALLAPPQD